jgi:hypothetical protein
MTDDQSPINELFTDSEPIDTKAIVDVLKNYIRIKRETREIFFTDLGNDKNISDRMLIYGLSKKVLKVGNHSELETFSAKEITVNLQLKKGTVDGTFSILKKRGLILGSGSEYIIPNYKILEILKMLGDQNAKRE